MITEDGKKRAAFDDERAMKTTSSSPGKLVINKSRYYELNKQLRVSCAK
jgi:hypothetical protein